VGSVLADLLIGVAEGYFTSLERFSYDGMTSQVREIQIVQIKEKNAPYKEDKAWLRVCTASW